jgi:hypothetical protein
VADFTTGAPPEIDLGAGAFSSPACFAAPDASTVTAAGHLALVSAPSTDDIIQLNQPFNQVRASFPSPTWSVQGTEMVATIDDEVSEPTPNMCTLSCRSRTRYHVDWYVDRADPKRYGLRNFRIEPAEILCCSSYYLPV